MKDKTMVMMALLFLTLTVGSGVNYSLEKCNQMLGAPMAPSARDLYNQKVPHLVNSVEAFAEYGREQRKMVVRGYPELARYMENTGKTVGGKMLAETGKLRENLTQFLERVKTRAGLEKTSASE